MQEIKIINQNLSREALFHALKSAGIPTNAYADLIFNHPAYNYTDAEKEISIAELTLHDLGLKDGGNFKQIEEAVQLSGYSYCPLEAAPYIRMHYRSQKIAQPKTESGHPPDSILIFSKPMLHSDDFPKGFYLRNIEGILWLRAYIASDDYFWEPDTQLIVKKL
ncbi:MULTISPECIES: hypothetical protein [Chryseobacterium]|uniref:Helicase n=1 Tax=Chryseobacterium camelliae TaxID=1265445 RepID=A0ABU0TKM2_9FLAO|nr:MULTISPECIES: hypothetical protein [Chryseobacterium]MDT3408542.1 hypothetical protein [Pseudacidovorax intermedius]MDQ1097603.1 hypothetical protein [Chryseobacterium camelliae]MDQ1101532.1 hypothetical protein [Chryseobacterium sp. SORGH_AS_1048]MDR6084975.1 hypothetical protein [Chryseobacterium sp. SORGH_AS_0909]MDR6129328.1 hypothetical protein [Chryseobacterium sp. SORGH_AS_1175]